MNQQEVQSKSIKDVSSLHCILKEFYQAELSSNDDNHPYTILLEQFKKHPKFTLNLFFDLIQREIKLGQYKMLERTCIILSGFILPIEKEVEGFRKLIKRKVIDYFSREEMFNFIKKLILAMKPHDNFKNIHRHILKVIQTIEEVSKYKYTQQIISILDSEFDFQNENEELFTLQIHTCLRRKTLQENGINLIMNILAYIERQNQVEQILGGIDILTEVLKSSYTECRTHKHHLLTHCIEEVQYLSERAHLVVQKAFLNDQYILRIEHFDQICLCLKHLASTPQERFGLHIIQFYSEYKDSFDKSKEGLLLICLIAKQRQLIEMNQVQNGLDFIDKLLILILNERRSFIFSKFVHDFISIYQYEVVKELYPELQQLFNHLFNLTNYQLCQSLCGKLLIDSNKESQELLYLRIFALSEIYQQGVTGVVVIKKIEAMFLNILDYQPFQRFSIYNFIISWLMKSGKKFILQFWKKHSVLIQKISAEEQEIANQFCIAIIVMTYFQITDSQILKNYEFIRLLRKLEPIVNDNFDEQKILINSLLSNLPIKTMQQVPRFWLLNYSQVLIFLLKQVKSEELLQHSIQLSLGHLNCLHFSVGQRGKIQIQLFISLIRNKFQNKFPQSGIIQINQKILCHRLKLICGFTLKDQVFKEADHMIYMLYQIQKSKKQQKCLLTRSKINQIISSLHPHSSLVKMTMDNFQGLANGISNLLYQIIYFFNNYSILNSKKLKIVCYIIFKLLEKNYIFKGQVEICRAIQLNRKDPAFIVSFNEFSIKEQQKLYQSMKKTLLFHENRFELQVLVFSLLALLFQQAYCNSFLYKGTSNQHMINSSEEVQILAKLAIRTQKNIEQRMHSIKQEAFQGKPSLEQLEKPENRNDQNELYRLLSIWIKLSQANGGIIALIGISFAEQYKDVVNQICEGIEKEFQFFSDNQSIFNIPNQIFLLLQLPMYFLSRIKEIQVVKYNQLFEKLVRLCGHPSQLVRYYAQMILKIILSQQEGNEQFKPFIPKVSTILESEMKGKFKKHWIDDIAQMKFNQTFENYYTLNIYQNQHQVSQGLNLQKLNASSINQHVVENSLIALQKPQQLTKNLKILIKGMEESKDDSFLDIGAVQTLVGIILENNAASEDQKWRESIKNSLRDKESVIEFYKKTLKWIENGVIPDFLNLESESLQ